MGILKSIKNFGKFRVPTTAEVDGRLTFLQTEVYRKRNENRRKNNVAKNSRKINQKYHS